LPSGPRERSRLIRANPNKPARKLTVPSPKAASEMM
jgi:hypothetical protein